MEELEAEEEMNNWIEEHVDLGVKEGDAEWEEMKKIYLEGGQQLADDWEDYNYDDITFHLTNEDIALASFENQINFIEGNLDDQISPLLTKMKYSYVVTLMEAFLGDMTKDLIISNDKYLINALTKIEEIKEIKISLYEIYNDKDLVNKKVLGVLSGYIYHNIGKVLRILRLVLGEDIPDNVKVLVGDIIEVIKIRHDIVHRNGRTLDDIQLEINEAQLYKAIDITKKFIYGIYAYIHTARNKLQQESQ